MPNSTQDSSGSPPPSATPSASAAAPLTWKSNAILFAATVVSIFLTQAFFDNAPFSRGAFARAAQFAGTILAILVSHELGHYVAARIHKVDASLPYFIPLPGTLIGTMGAVIRMRGVIPTRAALLDIGASGPLAGMAVAIPLYIIGVQHSHPVALDGSSMLFFGEPVLTRVLDHFFAPPIPEGMDLAYSPMAEAAWAGMLVTMINLVPVGQLDGGHVAYALFGTRQDRIAPWVHRSMLAFFFVGLASSLLRDARAGIGLFHIGRHVGNSLFWLVWFEVQAILGALASRGRPQRDDRSLPIRTRAIAIVGLALIASFGRESHSVMLWLAWFVGLGGLIAMEATWGVLRNNGLLDHPPTGAAKLGIGRSIVAILTLVLFALLFMPTPISM